MLFCRVLRILGPNGGLVLSRSLGCHWGHKLQTWCSIVRIRCFGLRLLYLRETRKASMSMKVVSQTIHVLVHVWNGYLHMFTIVYPLMILM